MSWTALILGFNAVDVVATPDAGIAGAFVQSKKWLVGEVTDEPNRSLISFKC
jgi:hypothetical protein